jgi:hypothetical protein
MSINIHATLRESLRTLVTVVDLEAESLGPDLSVIPGSSEALRARRLHALRTSVTYLVQALEYSESCDPREDPYGGL